MRLIFVVLLSFTTLFAEIERVYPLTDEWIVVVYSNMDDVQQIANSRSIPWSQARKSAREFDLDQLSHYTVDGQVPTQLTRYITSVGGNKIRDISGVNYAHYIYLSLAQPLKKGQHQASVGDEVFSFEFDDWKTVSRAIKVNQEGYLSDSEKIGYVGGYLHALGPLPITTSQFQLVDSETEEVVYNGLLSLKAESARFKVIKDRPEPRPLISGESLYEADFSEITRPGRYYLRVPRMGRSWEFVIGDEAYGRPFYVATRGLFHQRCGIELGRPYTDWPRIECHTQPVYQAGHLPFFGFHRSPKGFHVFDVIAATIDRSSSFSEVRGGWHDAADWDRRIQHILCALDLLYLYEMYPEKFVDGQLNLPESGDGVPDILNEVEWGLKCWLTSQARDGGIGGFIETWTHPRIDDHRFSYTLARPNRWSSLIYAGAAAHFARLVAPFDPLRAGIFARSARLAYEYGMDDDHDLGLITLHAKKNRGTGASYSLAWQDNPEWLIPYKIFARTQLYNLSLQDQYLEGVSDLLVSAPKPMAWPFTNRDFSVWLYWGILQGEASEKIPLIQRKRWEDFYLEKAEKLVQLSREQPYRFSWPLQQDYWMAWGATCFTNQARTLLQAYVLSGQEEFRLVAICNANAMLGLNPLGMSWTTGLGTVYPVEIQHEVSKTDGLKDPVPGITIYGVTGGMFYDLKKKIWEGFMDEENKNLPVFRQFSVHPEKNTMQCEFTIFETMSSSIFTFGALMSEGWLPEGQISVPNPAPEGEYFLP